MTLAQQLAARTLELVQTDSVYGDEACLADHLEAWAAGRFGAAQVRRVGNSLVAGAPRRPGRPLVALVGHLDTVPAHPGDPAPAIEGGRVVGLGASDMKGGVAVALALADALELEALPYDLLWVLYDKEEGPHEQSGLGPVLEACPELAEIELAVVMEPTDGVAQVGCVGSIHATLTFEGKAAHSARPWHGENAVHKAGPFLAELAALAPAEVEVEGHIFREVVSITLAEGGRFRNVIPERFTLNLNYRFAPGRSLDEAQRQVEAWVAGRAQLRFDDLAPSGAVPAPTPLYRHFLTATGVEVAPKQAWTDVARLSEAGIPALNYGPGLTSQAHQQGEYCEIDALVASYEALWRFLSQPA